MHSLHSVTSIVAMYVYIRVTAPILLPWKEKGVRLSEFQPYLISDYFYTKLLAENSAELFYINFFFQVIYIFLQ